MLTHPHIDPVALHLGPLSIRWYGLMYLVGFVCFLVLGHYRIRRNPQSGWNTQQLDDLLFYGVLGVILGGRLGYVLFYKPMVYLAQPLDIFKIWEGGMAFHGGFLGVLVAMWLFGRKTGRTFFQVTDFIAPLVPLGLAAGRLGNFINGELWGRVTSADAPWAMVFPLVDQLPRHPSQLYQFALEGLLLFAVLWIYSAKPRRTGQVSALFLFGYGLCRFVAEFAREPDNFLGFLALGFSMGQWLSLPMIVLGAWLWVRFSRK
ncbi:prolipoprotein diacylglyceryl transferase [Chitinimonas sp. BJB300]|uniref:prolipoprotein diacylglyceryl transferase n=1 Tax=Chitinimonas sp. BJB300 TaxID=1559339 RepID=UPI000C0FE8B7|nr:prolipoprotein diacylglyceryl transferase [Chitinimonas sp. BJB300]PHV09571.1 prolipoprotein diacylglyceryl transferase [Chitinimonas sp. BJB300]TSJ83780.1 prolipoprotein diacylglyceryl transferase [Chitinimonas sp. BJB300]